MVVRLHYSSDFFKKYEYGSRDSGGTISLRQVFENGLGRRDFESYSFDVRCNTEPPSVGNLTVLQYNYSENDERYVLAFNMPDMSLIHKDINRLVINGKNIDFF